MKILESYAGALTNFEVLNFLNSRGASRDPTRVIASIAQSEYKVYDYLFDTAACSQTRECINEFLEKCKKYNLAKAEMLNIINLRPCSVVEIDPIIENCENRLGEKVEELVEMVKEMLPPVPTALNNEKAIEKAKEETGDPEQAAKHGSKTAGR
ncbi:uncharacterized protein LOC110820081 isoform X1 [Carica papaya]|uniref:uncharacterized protein LOC110820081 isoform X1 n=1 Tax=Carica papaya TaxID=3649 RepID=UPI000B8CF444|nr:uncharacterized protein LOC110820081 isoform X1 [Carica papaya]